MFAQTCFCCHRIHSQWQQRICVFCLYLSYNSVQLCFWPGDGIISRRSGSSWCRLCWYDFGVGRTGQTLEDHKSLMQVDPRGAKKKCGPSSKK